MSNDVGVTFEGFCAELVHVRVRHPEWREGQLLYHHLFDHRPDLLAKIALTDLDPFYDDSRTDSCLAWLGENWE